MIKEAIYSNNGEIPLNYNENDVIVLSKDALNKYKNNCRPYLFKMMEALKLNVAYYRAEGNYLFYSNENGETVGVLDCVGGYGAAFLGHNHPYLMETAIQIFNTRMPFNGQGSIRTYAAQLGELLSRMIGERTGKEYITTFTNSGAECVEAAMKHAELQYQEKIEAVMGTYDKCESILYRAKTYTIDEGSLEELKNLELINDATPKHEILTVVKNHTIEVLYNPGVFFALSGSFHGKTRGALGLTSHPLFRLTLAFRRPPVIFLERNNIDDFRRAVKTNRITFYMPIVNKKQELRFEKKTMSIVRGFFIEPIQGEGGIHEITSDYCRFCRDIADIEDFPLIFDEIQSGMGRTGTLLYSEQLGINADYYLLSKSLGGGIAKIGAVIIDKHCYRDIFGYIHTSTFAEDDFSCRMAIESLKIITGPEKLMDKAREKGGYLIRGLKEIRSKYPQVIKDVRGVGLMIGVEFNRLTDSASPVLRTLSRQENLGYVIGGYLLNEHAIRVMPTLSNSHTLRLEPPAYVGIGECDRVLEAFEELCRIICYLHTAKLMRYLAKSKKSKDTIPVKDYSRPRQHNENAEGCTKVAFIGHFIKAEHLPLFDRGLEDLTFDERNCLVKRCHEFIDPEVYEKIKVTASSGKKVHIRFIGLFLDSATIKLAMENGDLSRIRSIIQKAVNRAEREGCRAIGFGGFSSIVTNNCMSVVNSKAALTTGNALTVAMGIDAIKEAAVENGSILGESVFAGVGATGNICRQYCEIMSEEVGQVLLIGRPVHRKRLLKIAFSMYEGLYKKLIGSDYSTYPEKSGVMRRMLCAVTTLGLDFDDSAKELSGHDIYTKMEKTMGDEAPIIISTDMDDLQRAQIIVSATNEPEPIIFPRHLGASPIIVNDIAVPADVDSSVVGEKPNVKVIAGGVVKLPNNPDFTIGGIPLPEGHTYACMAETLLMGLMGISEDYSYGRISMHQVKMMAEYAKLQGFSLGDAQEEKSL